MTELTERVARLEGAYEHLATKADVERLRADLTSQIANQTKWIVGILGSLMALAVAVIKYLPD